MQLHTRIATCIIAALACIALPAAAQGLARKPLTLVVPVVAGAGNDFVARALAPEVRDELGAAIVENRPGANSAIGAEFVKRAAPDGRTLLVAPSSFVILAAMDVPLPFNFVRDFEPVIYATSLPFYLVVNEKALPAKSVAELVQMVHEQRGRISYGSAGNGSPHHFAAEMLKLRAGLEILHVPYKGMAQGIGDLLEGRIQLVITGLPAVAAHLKSGRLRVLATTEGRRTALRPDIPTFAEAGVPGVEMETWFGILAPAGTPRAVIEATNTAFNNALALPSVREKLAAQGLEAVGGRPEAYAKRIRADIANFRKVVQAANIKLN